MAKKDEEKKKKEGSYSAEDITVLEGLEPVRKRPGMYIGTTGSDGLHHLIWEVFDNSRDEAMGGFANRIEITLLPFNRVRVADNGRGIPVDTHKQTKVSALETIMTTLHAGGKFGGEGYKVSGGLHGVGVSVVNALSVFTKAEVHRDGGMFVQEYKQGKPRAKVKKVKNSKLIGTIITFEPDPEIFKEIKFIWERIVDHVRQQAYLVKKLKITVIDARELKEQIDDEDVFWIEELGIDVPSMSFYFEGGLASMVSFYNQPLKPIHKNIFYLIKGAAPSGSIFLERLPQETDPKFAKSSIISTTNAQQNIQPIELPTADAMNVLSQISTMFFAPVLTSAAPFGTVESLGSDWGWTMRKLSGSTNPSECGNGILDSGEQCEPPNTATCSAICQNIAASTTNGTGALLPGSIRLNATLDDAAWDGTVGLNTEEPYVNSNNQECYGIGTPILFRTSKTGCSYKNISYAIPQDFLPKLPENPIPLGDYKITGFLQTSLSYDGRLQGKGKAIHTMRAEARAYF